jgi:hypothetical protein
MVRHLAVILSPTRLVAQGRPRVVDERSLSGRLGNHVGRRALVTIRMEKLQPNSPGALDLAVVGVA